MHPVADGVACTLENGLMTSTDTISLSEVEFVADFLKKHKENRAVRERADIRHSVAMRKITDKQKPCF